MTLSLACTAYSAVPRDVENRATLQQGGKNDCDLQNYHNSGPGRHIKYILKYANNDVN